MAITNSQITQVISNLANPAGLLTNVGFQYGVKTGEAAAPAVVNAVGETITDVKTSVSNAVSGTVKSIGDNLSSAAGNLGKALSGFTVNFGFLALIVILFIALFFKAVDNG